MQVALGNRTSQPVVVHHQREQSRKTSEFGWHGSAQTVLSQVQEPERRDVADFSRNAALQRVVVEEKVRQAEIAQFDRN